MSRIKVITTSKSPSDAGDHISTKIDRWIDDGIADDKYYRIDQVHTNSNQYGWMVAITYTVCDKFGKSKE